MKVEGKSHKDQQNIDPEPPLTLRSNPPTTGTVPQTMRPESDLGTPPQSRTWNKITDDGKSLDKAVRQNPVLFRTTPSSQRKEL